MSKRIMVIAIGVAFLLSIMGTAHARQHITATLKADPATYTGTCPGKITFKGSITATEPGRVQYKFIRSDGALAPTETLNFSKPGSKFVSSTWTIGKDYSGWKAIKVIYPQELESNKANFKIVCKAAGAKPDLIVSDIRLIKDCKIQIMLKNIGNGGVPDSAYHKTQGAGVQMYNGGKPWGGIRLFAIDPSKALKTPGKSISYVWFPGAKNLQLGPGAHTIKVIVDNNNAVAESNEGNNTRTERLVCKGGASQGDLSVRIARCPKSVKQGQDLGATFQVMGRSTFPNPLTSVAVDIILTSKRTYPVPAPYAVYSPNYSDGVLLKGGREHISFKGPRTVRVKLNGSNTIPANTPPGMYYLGAVIDAGDKVKEGNEKNNVAFCRIKVEKAVTARPDLGMYGFLKIGKQKKQVKWNESIVLTPSDATLISQGKPAFEVYYSYREYQGVAASGFKNKIFFNGDLRSQQTNLSLGPKQIKNVHTQAYLGPENGRLQIKIDADNEVNETREDNNFHFYVNLQFSGF